MAFRWVDSAGLVVDAGATDDGTGTGEGEGVLVFGPGIESP